MILHTDRLVLRPFAEEDYLFYLSLETNPLALKYEADEAPTQEQLVTRFQGLLDLEGQDKRTKFAFLVEKAGIPLGKVVIWQIDQYIDEWEMGWVLLPEHAGHGYASEASKALIAFGFRELGANRICANCNADNIASEKVMQRIGMTKEGVLRETRKLRGKYYGSCIYSILKSEFSE